MPPTLLLRTEKSLHCSVVVGEKQGLKTQREIDVAKKGRKAKKSKKKKGPNVLSQSSTTRNETNRTDSKRNEAT